MARRAVIASLLVALPLLAACGDDAPSKEDFLAEADPVCKRGNEIVTVFTTPSDVPMMKDFATKMADSVEKTAGELDKLKFPGGTDGKAAKDMVKAMRDAAGAARAVVPDVDAKNYPNIEQGVTKFVDAFKNVDTKARALGSAECGKGAAEMAGKLGTVTGETVKKAYIAQADALCATANDELDAIPEPETMAEVKESLEKSAARFEKLLNDVKAIPKPDFDRAKLTDALTSADQALAKLKEGGGVAGSGNERQLDRWFEELAEAFDLANARADAYGFKDCGSQAT